MEKKTIFFVLIGIIALFICIGLIYVISSSAPEDSQLEDKSSYGTSGNPNFPQNSPSSVTGDASSSGGSGGSGGGGSGGNENGETSNSQDPHYCTDESRLVENCEDIDQPVCGWYDESKQIECNWGPCVRGAFPNECEACQNENILYWTDGDCPVHG